MAIQRIPALIAAATALLLALPCRGEVSEVRVAQQFGIAYLPLIVAKEQHLIEHFVHAAGQPEPKITWLQFSSATGMNDALLSNNLDFASGGIAPLITLWARTVRTLKVRGIATLGSIPNDLNTNRPEIKKLTDFTERDRIALPAVGVSIQAIMLQMAAEQAFGPGQTTRLDPLTVSMSHPDGVVALVSGRLEITGHFTSPPFQQQELQRPGIHRVLSSYDVLGGPHSFNAIWCTSRFHDDNPVTARALLQALDAAMAFIVADPKAAASIYRESEKSNLSQDFVQSLIAAPENRYTTVPEQSMKFAAFQHRVGLIKEMPASWKDLFFPALHDRPGS
jgi:NitT/TauT family transport system substrate-binding protein